jgi:hypothetical protein
MGYYDVAQICINGHIVTRNANRSPEFRQNHCKKCGEPTIMQCPSCETDIQGEYHVDGVFVGGFKTPPPPNFCHQCGQPYPWTERKIQAARDLADEFDELSAEDREKLKSNLDDLYKDTPQTEVAASRFKRIMSKVGKDSYSAMKSIVTDIASETIKKSLFGG